MDTTTLKKGLLALLVIFGLTVGSTPVSAQLSGAPTNTEVVPGDPGGPVQPLSDLARIPVVINYRYSPGGADLVATPINVEITNNPSWITATMSPSTVYAPVEETNQDGQQTVQVESTLVLQTTADAPAFQQGNVQIQATAQSNGNMEGSSGTATVAVTAGFYSILNAQTPQKVVTARPQQKVDLPITITNLGNANTNVFLDIESGDEKLIQNTVLPSPVTVPSKQQGSKDNTQTVLVQVQTPFKNGYINEPGVLSMKISSTYALDQSVKGMSTRVSSLITTKGFYVPGPTMPAMLASLLGVALVMGRGRFTDDE